MWMFALGFFAGVVAVIVWAYEVNNSDKGKEE